MSTERWSAPPTDTTIDPSHESIAAQRPTPVDAPVAPADAAPGAAVGVDRSADRRAPTRASGAWTAAVGATVLLLALAIFAAQNTHRAEVTFLAWHGRAPTAVLLLIACVAGAGLVAVVGVARILQLRHRDRAPGRRSHRHGARLGGGSRTVIDG